MRPGAAGNVDAREGGRETDDADAQRGWAAYQRGDVESARAALAVAAGRPAVRPWVRYALGLSDYALRDYRDAIAQWENVRTAAPEFQPVYFDLADAYLQISDPEKAIRVMRTAKERWPQDAEVSNALGVAQVIRGALDDAVRSFQQAVAAAPAEGVGYFNLGKALEMRYARSRRYVQQTGTWVANEQDRSNAIASYERYLTIGGPFENAVREGLSRLAWKAP
jgi:tetratricopeptide (TPR) repeat protein